MLLSPDERSCILTFCIKTDLIAFTGDSAADAQSIETMIDGYSGNNLKLDGSYELISVGDNRGFRAFGSWQEGNLNAEMTILTGSGSMFSFVLVGDEAIALEESILASVVLPDVVTGEADGGFIRWDCSSFTISYPEDYGTFDLGTGVAFISSADPNNIIMARTYSLGFEYADAMSVSIVSQVLPKSTGVEPSAYMVSIGGWNTAVIKGTVSDGPMKFYVIGRGQTALALMLTGSEACTMAEQLIAGIDIK